MPPTAAPAIKPTEEDESESSFPGDFSDGWLDPEFEGGDKCAWGDAGDSREETGGGGENNKTDGGKPLLFLGAFGGDGELVDDGGGDCEGVLDGGGDWLLSFDGDELDTEGGGEAGGGELFFGGGDASGDGGGDCGGGDEGGDWPFGGGDEDEEEEGGESFLDGGESEDEGGVPFEGELSLESVPLEEAVPGDESIFIYTKWITETRLSPVNCFSQWFNVPNILTSKPKQC